MARIISSKVGKFARDVDLSRLGRGKWSGEWILNRRSRIALAVGEFTKLATLFKDLFASPEVDAERDGDDYPYWTVEYSNAHDVPFHRDPTPQLSSRVSVMGRPQRMNAYRCGPIHLALPIYIDEKVDKRRNERQTIAEDEVFPLEGPQLLRAIFMEERQVDVTSHCQGPESICRKEPASRQPEEQQRDVTSNI